MPSLAGSFLVARPVIQDPNFKQTVVLLLEHDSGGAFGLVVNRPLPVEDVPFPVFAGGPCPSQGLFLLHGHEDWVKIVPDEPKPQIAPGIFLGDASCLKRATDALPGEEVRFRVFKGYAGWGAGQLESELAGADWAVVPASGKVLFGTPAEELWDLLLPPRIPQPSVN
jgi:putative transcriptional regulator